VSLLTIALFALGYVVVVVFVLALLRAASRSDEAAQREYEALVRSRTERPRVVRLRDRDPEHASSRRRWAG
jgi:hypothetical protein